MVPPLHVQLPGASERRSAHIETGRRSPHYICVAASLSERSIIKASGYVLIILLNSDEILKTSPLGSDHQQMKQRQPQIACAAPHVFLHLLRIFQFEAQQAETAIKEEDGDRRGVGGSGGERGDKV